MFDWILKLSVRNSVFVNLMFVLVVAMGLVSAARLPREEFPEVSLDRVSIITRYPGATAADVEELITKPLEDALEDVSDIDKVTSTSQEGASSVLITFLEGTDLQVARSEVEKATSSVEDLPDTAETPVVRELTIEIPVVSLALLGDPGATQLVEDLADELRDIDGVSMVSLTGVAERKIFVDLDEVQLRALRLQAEDVAQAIRSAQANVPAGSVELEGTDISVKTEQRLQSAADVARIPLRPGSLLRLGDIAEVRMVAEPDDTEVWVDGHRAVKMTIGREKSGDPLRIRGDVEALLETLRLRLPPGTSLIIADDFTTSIEDRLTIVGYNALGGGVLVILVLLVMSGWRQALLAVLGMPVSFLMATFLMDRFGVTMNGVSTFGLLIAVGIIVDDAIVVIENVQRHLEMGKSRIQATLEGAREVVLPVTVAVLTTCLAFWPLTMVSGTMGRVMQILPLVVIFCLMGSLFEAVFLLPGHLAHYASTSAQGGRTARLGQWMKRIYRPLLTFCVRRPWIVNGLVVVIFASTAWLATTMPFQANAPAKPYSLAVFYETMPGIDHAQTKAQGKALDDIVDKHMGSLVKSRTLRVGSYIDEATGRTSLGPNLAKARWEFDVTERAALRAYPAMVRELRLHLAVTPEFAKSNVQELEAGPPSGAGVTAKLRGREIEQLNEAVTAVKAVFKRVPGVSDIRDDYGSGRETFRVRVDQDRAARLGLTELQIGQAVRTAIDGLLALEVSIDEEPVDIVVRYAEARSRGRNALRDLVIATPSGSFVRLDQVASIERTREVGFINREDGFRTVQVLGELDVDVSAPLVASNKVQAIWDEELKSRFPGVELSFGGEAEELLKSLEDLPALFLMAILMIYFVLALQFRSYFQPAIIIAAVPFGLMGSVLGLAALGYDLSIFAMFGMVALSGIVVNDSLVMVDFINTRRADGLDVQDAVIDGALDRLRPIVSTTLTTCLGLMPMALGMGGRDETLAPMAISIAAGLGIATVLVLLVVPAIYVLVERVSSMIGGRLGAHDSRMPH